MARKKKTKPEPLATCEGVELPLHPGHAKGEDPWGLGSRGRVIVVGARESLTIGELATRVRDSGTRVPEVREVTEARDLITVDPQHKAWGHQHAPTDPGTMFDY